MSVKRRYLILIVATILLIALGMYIFLGRNQFIRDKLSEQQQSQTVRNEKTIDKSKIENEDKQDYSQINDQLSRLLPEKINYKWVYNGFAEYAHVMTLVNIDKSKDQIRYEIKGNVEDMSGGESGKSPDFYNIKITYLVKNGVLMQIKSEQAMMDSIFNDIELIKAPLQKDNSWTQDQTDKTGKRFSLECKITDIVEEDGHKVYTIIYKDKGSDYYETRKIKEGIGVISFQKPWKDDEGNTYELGYTLYEDASGYK